MNYNAMNYGGYYPQSSYLGNGYPPNAFQQPTQQNGGINWVQGEEGAKAFAVVPGQSVLLMDAETSAFYIKSTDPSGMPLPLRVFDYTERTAQKQTIPAPQSDFVTRKEFTDVQSKLDELSEIVAAKSADNKQKSTENGEKGE